MRPSDWYMMIMNEIDEKLEAAGLDTRIVFIAYVDTLWGPEKIGIKNPKRFSLLYAPITRSYCESFREDCVLPEPLPTSLLFIKAATVKLLLCSGPDSSITRYSRTDAPSCSVSC